MIINQQVTVNPFGGMYLENLAQQHTLGICDNGNCTCDQHLKLAVRWDVGPNVTNGNHDVKVYCSWHGAQGSPSYVLRATVDPIADTASNGCTAISPSEDGSHTCSMTGDISACKGVTDTSYYQFKLELIRQSDSAVIATYFTDESSSVSYATAIC